MSNTPVEAHVYELQRGEWVEIVAMPRPSRWERFAGIVAGALAVAAIAAITILAAALMAILLPVGLLLAWLAARRRT